ncbi:alpha-N-arabinofuranosidase [Tessaracoccus rhinocerotis]|uniref:non-reducing end alpha-L-arabinofuranosidase n=1 Tax=Tessaracoccus rhinocerotis TaxID=1689449 RepID=A0A553K4S6_9ACTN|nr:alpha-L-arabinofuranosidase C-terminal domain-containing protein [Tessaracoccus rhinocerotis]TRY19709.1 alpha-N-arabinofuranosidase [Tessaracoccus rhinocerotis]
MSETQPSTAVINLDVPGHTISKHVYGHFAEHLGHCIYDGIFVGEDSPIPNVRGIRTDVVDALKAIEIPNLRWPGGCFADEYHWRDGVGPRSERPTVVNTHWGDVVEDNSFGTHEFMDLCEQLGTDPYICGNVGSGTVREMADWVEYLTRSGSAPMSELRRTNGREEPWKVPFWGIGNESWGCGGNMRAEYYADLARQYSTYCREHDGNKLYKIAGGANIDDYHWTETLMKTLGDLGCGCNPRHFFDAISLHYYTYPGEWEPKQSATDFDAETYYDTMRSAWQVDELLTRHGNVMDVYDPSKRIGLVLDEWGTWFAVEPGTNPGFLYQQNTIRDALVASVHFDSFHRHADRLVMANIAQTVNVLQAVLLTDGDTLIKTPTYHVFEMNKGHQDAQLLQLSWIGGALPTRTVGNREIPLVSGSASTTAGRALISLSNLDLEASHEVIVDLRGHRVTDVAGRILTAGAVHAHNTADQPDAVVPRSFDVANVTDGRLAIELPAHSLVTLELTLG